MTTLDEYLRRQLELHERMAQRFEQASLFQSTYLAKIQHQQELNETYAYTALQREVNRYRELQEQVINRLRAPVGTLNATTLLSERHLPPISSILAERELGRLVIPDTYRTTLAALGARARDLHVTGDLDRLLERLQRYADEKPTQPDDETLAEVKERVERVIAANTDRFTEAFADLLRWLVGRRQLGIASFILFTVVYPFLLTVFQDELKQRVHRYLPSEAKRVTRELNAEVTTTVPPELLANLRYVSGHNLRIRSASRRNSACKGTLHFGDVVIVVRATKDWTLIEHSEDESHLRGWVMTRYLRRFRR